MKTILLKSATLLDPESKFHLKKTDILIRDGKIEEIGADLKEETSEVLDLDGQFICPGFVDLNANFGEPGLETKEDLVTGTRAAAAGGFTGVAVMPNTEPPIHSKAEVAYIVNRSEASLVNVYPLGALSRNREGKDLAELYDMSLAGARAFTDGDHPLSDAGLMSRALLYAKGFGGLIISYPEDRSIAGNAKMNEGVMSTLLGMKGIPALAEELVVSRDLFLAEYQDAAVHFTTISTAGSVGLIREAKAKGLKVTCDVAAHHLVFTEEQLSGFDSNLKVKPPLRTRADAEALKAGLLDGTIDAVVSQHTPHEIEFKDVEFEIAYYGIIGFQTVLPLMVQAGLTPEVIAEKLSSGPRNVLRLPKASIQAGMTADLVAFDPAAEWEFNSATNHSRSANSPLFNQKLRGRVSLVCNNNQIFIS
jgi:dihydroorotase